MRVQKYHLNTPNMNLICNGGRNGLAYCDGHEDQLRVRIEQQRFGSKQFGFVVLAGNYKRSKKNSSRCHMAMVDNKNS